MLKPTFRFLGCHDDFAALQFHARVLIDALRIEARERPARRQREREAKEKAEDYHPPQGGCPLLLAWTTTIPAPLGEPNSTRSMVRVFWPCWKRTSPRKMLPKSRTWNLWRP